MAAPTPTRVALAFAVLRPGVQDPAQLVPLATEDTRLQVEGARRPHCDANDPCLSNRAGPAVLGENLAHPYHQSIARHWDHGETDPASNRVVDQKGPLAV